jgi:hypothetical protein
LRRIWGEINPAKALFVTPKLTTEVTEVGRRGTQKVTMNAVLTSNIAVEV